ncbi:MAG: hypothetical protein QM770_07925 [Tepidisphaeraceae bacterium]
MLNADRLPSRFVVMADRGPSERVYENPPALPSANSKPVELARLNSPNHSRAGQNVLYADGSVRFVTTPYCGVGFDEDRNTPGDNIYSAVSTTPLLDVTPHDAVGFVETLPAYRFDTYLSPAAP